MSSPKAFIDIENPTPSTSADVSLNSHASGAVAPKSERFTELCSPASSDSDNDSDNDQALIKQVDILVVEIKKLEKKLKTSLVNKNETIEKLENEIEKLKNELKMERDEKMNLVQELEKYRMDSASSGRPNDGADLNLVKLEQMSPTKKDYLGMFAYINGEENIIMQMLITELKPRTAIDLLPPALPAYIVFMCIRHTDYINDVEKARTLLSEFMSSIKKLIANKPDDLETMALWLSNTIRLLNLMKQYGGKPEFQETNTPKQNNQSLRNFDLTDYQQHLTDTSLWIYRKIVRYLSEKLEPLILPAIVEHDEFSGLLLGSNSLRGQQNPTEAILQELTTYYETLTLYGVDWNTISQLFKQIFYFLCAFSLNNLLLRKEWCNRSTGIRIQRNLSQFEMWTREKQLNETEIQKQLQPIFQAAHLLEVPKKIDNVDNICEICSDLSPLQISKILKNYTPGDYEWSVSDELLERVQTKLKERPCSKYQD